MYTIKEASQLSGFSADTIRYYEKMEILNPSRGANQYRYFSEQDLLALNYIAVMKYANFSLGDIKVLMQTFVSKPSEECNQKISETLDKKQQELITKIQMLNQILQLIEKVQRKIEKSKD